jgi:hypothetical protein
MLLGIRACRELNIGLATLQTWLQPTKGGTMPLEPTVPNPPNPWVGLEEVVEAQRQRDLARERRRRDRQSAPPSEFGAAGPGGSVVEQNALGNRRQARLNGDPVPPLGGELRQAE